MYLTPEQLAQIKDSIDKQRQEILDKLNQRCEEGYEPEVRGDEADIANSEGIALTMERLQSRDRRLLKKLDEAMRWVDSEDFGYCESVKKLDLNACSLARQLASASIASKTKNNASVDITIRVLANHPSRCIMRMTTRSRWRYWFRCLRN